MKKKIIKGSNYCVIRTKGGLYYKSVVASLLQKSFDFSLVRKINLRSLKLKFIRLAITVPKKG